MWLQWLVLWKCVWKAPFSTELVKETMIFIKYNIIQWPMLCSDVNLTKQWYFTVKNNSGTVYSDFQAWTDGSFSRIQTGKSTQRSMVILQLRGWWLPWTVLNSPLIWHGKNVILGAVKQISEKRIWCTVSESIFPWQTMQTKLIKFWNCHK